VVLQVLSMGFSSAGLAIPQLLLLWQSLPVASPRQVGSIIGLTSWRLESIAISFPGSLVSCLPYTFAQHIEKYPTNDYSLRLASYVRMAG
jgi:hypothetical protein